MSSAPAAPLRARMREIIFGHETPLGKGFDVAIIWLIVASVLVVMLDSVREIRVAYGGWLRAAEWLFTIVFTVEYAARLWCAPSGARYARSFFGIVDVAAILPTYLSLFVPGGQALLAVRALRLLRVFRVLKLAQYVSEATVLMRALRASQHKITVFLASVVTLVVTLGSMMYLVEGGTNGFTSIPRSVYWAIVTLTTVGYGDLTPQPGLGQGLAAVIMLRCYGIIAVPTGMVTVEFCVATRQAAAERPCPECGLAEHDRDARHCKRCGARLPSRAGAD
jgi:voltage-gated potassium channel